MHGRSTTVVVPRRFWLVCLTLVAAFGLTTHADVWSAPPPVGPSLAVVGGRPLPAPDEVSVDQVETWSLEGQLLLPDDALARSVQMSVQEARRYRQVFQLQAEGRFAEADRIISGIKDSQLMGHVRAQRLLHPTLYKASYAELRAWLDIYNDQAPATAVYRLAIRRQIKGERPPRAPVEPSRLIPGNLENHDNKRPFDTIPRDRPAGDEGQLVDRTMAALKSGDPVRALGIAQQSSPGAVGNRLLAEVAAGFLYQGKVADAQWLAAPLAARHGDALPLASWVSGLASWRTGAYGRAARLFESVVTAEGASAWDVSAGAFWAARAHLRNGQPQRFSASLMIAAALPRTFYGLLARRLLGLDSEFHWSVPAISGRHLEALAVFPAGMRVIGLLQAGQRALAEAELERINPQGDPLLEEALLGIAVHAKMPALALRIGNALAGPAGARWDAALYPLPPWQPTEGFAIDPALAYAMMRQESRFDPKARSTAGATGLMQIMPDTASFMGGPDPRRPDGESQLQEPVLNLDLGQKYLTYLSQSPEIGNDLLRVLAAYNAGPANLIRWLPTMQAGDDPLLFIESLPARETRLFIERVLVNYWIYGLRLGQEPHSLEELAIGRGASFLLEPPPRLELTSFRSTP